MNAPSVICRYLPIVQSVLEIAGELDSAFLDGVHDVGQADELRLAQRKRRQERGAKAAGGVR